MFKEAGVGCSAAGIEADCAAGEAAARMLLPASFQAGSSILAPRCRPAPYNLHYAQTGRMRCCPVFHPPRKETSP